MVVYHFLFDLAFFGFVSINLSAPFFKVGVWIGLGLFMFLVGTSLAISYARRQQKTHFVFRGARVFLLGVIITIVTFTFFPQNTVVFGTLHFIGVAVLFAPLYLGLGVANSILALGVALITYAKPLFSFSHPLFIPTGLVQPNWYYFDYEPLIPWLFFVFSGVAFGAFFYQNQTRKLSVPDFSKLPVVSHLCALGRRSLVIYLIHQPILLSILFVLSYVR